MSAAVPPRLLVVLGEGGHTTELLQLVDRLGADLVCHYLVAAEDVTSPLRIRRPGDIHRVPRPRHDPGKRRSPVRDLWLGARCFVATLPVIWRVRPRALVTTGPWIGVVAGLAARCLGVRVVFIETGSRVTSLSATGRGMRWLAQDYFVQWDSLRNLVPRATYAGRLW